MHLFVQLGSLRQIQRLTTPARNPANLSGPKRKPKRRSAMIADLAFFRAMQIKASFMPGVQAVSSGTKRRSRESLSFDPQADVPEVLSARLLDHEHRAAIGSDGGSGKAGFTVPASLASARRSRCFSLARERTLEPFFKRVTRRSLR